MPVRPLEPGELFDLKYLRTARFSPDGRCVVYAVSYTDTVERFEIWIRDLDTRQRRRLPYAGNASAPRWSVDGRWLAFLGDGALRVAAFPSLDISPALTPQHLNVRGAPSWSPDGACLAVSLVERKVFEGPRRITTRHFRAEGIGFLDTLSQHIYEVDRTSGALRCLSGSITGLCSQPEWSPCGRRVLFFASAYAVPGYAARLLTVDVEDGTTHEVMGKAWFVAAARWLPGGERIAVAAAPDSAAIYPNPALWVIDRFGGGAQLRTPDITSTMGCRMHHDMPAWELTGDHVLTVLDERTAFVSVQTGGAVEIWRIALEGEAAVQRVLTGERSCLALDVNAAARSVLFAVSDLRSPAELWRASLDSYREERLTDLNDEILGRWPRMSLEHFTFASAGGLQIEAWFMRPASLKTPLPTVLCIHGGPFLATGQAFRYDFLLLASHGFGVLFANFRGSAGYGDAFTHAIAGDWGGRGFGDHVGAVDAAIERGLADPARLGVWGASHGGFATCWIVGHTQRFKAAVAEAAISNFTTLYYLSDAPDTFQGRMGGRPHEIPEIYRARSPITYAHRCTTPTLLIHGEEDLRCPISEAEQFYRALGDAGCVTELLRIPGCDHLGDSSGPLAARRAQNEALVDWFQRYL